MKMEPPAGLGWIDGWEPSSRDLRLFRRYDAKIAKGLSSFEAEAVLRVLKAMGQTEMVAGHA